MSPRRWLLLIGAVIWVVLGAAWYFDAAFLSQYPAAGWLAYVLAVLALLLVFETLIVFRQWVVRTWKGRHPDA